MVSEALVLALGLIKTGVDAAMAAREGDEARARQLLEEGRNNWQQGVDAWNAAADGDN